MVGLEYRGNILPITILVMVFMRDENVSSHFEREPLMFLIATAILRHVGLLARKNGIENRCLRHL